MRFYKLHIIILTFFFLCRGIKNVKWYFSNVWCSVQYAFIILLHGYFILSGNYDLEFSKSNILKYTDTRKKRYLLKHNELFQHMKKLPSWSRMDTYFVYHKIFSKNFLKFNIKNLNVVTWHIYFHYTYFMVNILNLMFWY